jgi:hypothetical protein
MRFAKRGKDDVETVREKVITVKTFGTQHFNWHEAVAAAVFHSQEGERIVAVIEAGYQ